MRRAPRPCAAMRARSSSVTSAPVGLPGELTTIALRPRRERFEHGVGVQAESHPRDGCGPPRGTAPASFTCSTMLGHPGACVITSSPASNSAIAALKSACLPPAVAITWSASNADAVVGVVSPRRSPPAARVLRRSGVYRVKPVFYGRDGRGLHVSGAWRSPAPPRRDRRCPRPARRRRSTSAVMRWVPEAAARSMRWENMLSSGC